MAAILAPYRRTATTIPSPYFPYASSDDDQQLARPPDPAAAAAYLADLNAPKTKP